MNRNGQNEIEPDKTLILNGRSGHGAALDLALSNFKNNTQCAHWTATLDVKTPHDPTVPRQSVLRRTEIPIGADPDRCEVDSVMRTKSSSRKRILGLHVVLSVKGQTEKEGKFVVFHNPGNSCQQRMVPKGVCISAGIRAGMWLLSNSSRWKIGLAFALSGFWNVSCEQRSIPRLIIPDPGVWQQDEGRFLETNIVDGEKWRVEISDSKSTPGQKVSVAVFDGKKYASTLPLGKEALNPHSFFQTCRTAITHATRSEASIVDG